MSQDHMLAPPGGLAPPHTGNHGSAPPDMYLYNVNAPYYEIPRRNENLEYKTVNLLNKEGM